MLIGADISAFQEGFNFRENQLTCPFIIIKQTEGLTWPEDHARTAGVIRMMRREAQEAGYVWVGLYHFARPQPGRTGRQEAEHFLSFTGPLSGNEGVVLDYEENKGLDREALEQFAIDFVDTIEERIPSLRGKVLFYSYPSFLANMSTDRLVQRCPLWIASYGDNSGKMNQMPLNHLDRWPGYAFWQYTSNGTAPGYAGRLDLNRYDGDEASLAGYGAGGYSQPPTSAPPTTGGTFVPEAWHGEYLRRGSSGIRVVQIQQRLKARGWNIGIDGEFGRATDTVVRKFQTEKGLTVDGIVGQSTWDAMYAFFEGVDVIPEPPLPQPPPTPPEPDPGPGNRHADPAGWCVAMGFDGNAGLNPVTEFQRAFNLGPKLQVDGIAGPATARAVQIVVDAGGFISAHFHMDELRCKHCGRIRFLREELVVMERIREEVGPYTPVSAYRCPVHNANIGGASLSMHKFGAACDLNIPLAVAERSGASGIGTCGDRCLHADDRANSGNNTTGGTPNVPTFWGYC